MDLDDDQNGDDDDVEEEGKPKAKKGGKKSSKKVDDDYDTELDGVVPEAEEKGNKGKKGKKSKKDDDFEAELAVEENDAEPIPAPAPSKKKGKKGKKVGDDDFEAELERVAAEIEAPAAAAPAAPAGKKGKKGKKGGEDDFEAELERVAAEVESAAAPEAPSAPEKKGKKGKKGAKADDEDAEEAAPAPEPSKFPEEDAGSDDDAEEGGAVKIKSKKEKERERKERQKLQKKEQQAKKVGSTPAVATPPPEAAPAPAAEDAESDNEEGAAGAADKKKKKKKKGASTAATSTPAEDEAAAAKGKKKPAAPLAAIKKALQAQKEAEEREKLRIEEEERKIREEEERIAAAERAKEEAKQKKKEKEKQKIEELKKSGQYLTPAQRAKKAAELAKLEAMKSAGLIKVPLNADGTAAETAKPKKVVYGNKKKKGGAKSDEKEPEAEAKSATAEDSPKAAEYEPEAVPESEPIATPSNGTAAVVPKAIGKVKDSWDDESEEEEEQPVAEVKDNWDDEEEESASVKKAAAVGPKSAPAPAKSASESKPSAATKADEEDNDDEEEEDNEDDGEDDDEDDEDNDDDGDDDDDDDDASSDEELTVAQRMALKRKQEAAERRQKRHEDALAARSAADLRSPICVILGHVDHGKTKLLDKIRQTNVQEGEAGGITQQIGATYFPLDAIKEKTARLNSTDGFEYRVPGLLMIDTPGHESFTNLRSRGSSLCNIAILVIDITQGLQPQTLESIGLLRQRKTPFIVALNKVDRLYGWKTIENNPIRDSLKLQDANVIKEFEDKVARAKLALMEQGLNSELYYENKNYAKFVSLVPTSAVTGEGIPDLLHLLIFLTQSRMSDSLMYLSEVEGTVLEVKVIEGLGTTIDVVLSNGVLHEGDRVVLCGLNGGIATTIRALLTPQPMRELRIKGQYIHHKSVKAALGVKISAPDLDKAIAGSRLLVVGPDDDEEDMKEEVMSDLTSLMKQVTTGRGVCVQASTLGSLEALLTFLKSQNIPVSGFNIGPVHKKDVIRASVMLERAREYAQLLAFDVSIDKEAADMAEELGVKIFKADVIYHLFDAFQKYMSDIAEQKKKDEAPKAIWPCILKPMATAVYNKRNPIIIGMDVVEGSLRIGTPLCVVNPEKQVIPIGKVTGIEVNHKARDIFKKGDPAMAVKIESASYETPKMYGRHFDHNNEIYSHVTRTSIDVMKTTFRNQMTDEDWKTIIKLKKVLNIT
ncbi:hypothetical protein BJ742DRAFT_673194 [Cladochytrium replicatum]|nr:hypothetical protein BJ742DRAFT_673194 [Cladochytrium replicatum]